MFVFRLWLVAAASAALLSQALIQPDGALARAGAARSLGVDRPDVWMRHSGRQGGEPAGEYFGNDVVTGDFNGDGVTDLAVSAVYDGRPIDTSPGRGRVYVYFGRGDQFPSLLDPADPACDSVISGTEPFARFGTELAVGDFDGDGLDDLAVSENELSNVFQGRVFLVSGARISTTLELRMDQGDYMSRISGRTAGPDRGHYLYFGFSLASGDFNQDGISDIAAGATGGDGIAGSRDQSGEVALFLGRRAGWPREIVAQPNEADVFIAGRTGGLFFGNELAAGDVDGDGRDELVAAAWGSYGPGRERPNAGDVSIFKFGAGSFATLPVPPDGPSASVGLVWDTAVRPPDGVVDGPATNSRIGASASDGGGRGLAIGDFDGDGFNDLVVGVPFYGPPSPNGKNKGGVFIAWGGPSLTRNTRIDLASSSLEPSAPASLVAVGGPGESLGDAVRLVDLTGDGRADLLAGAPDALGATGYAVAYGGRPRPAGVPTAAGVPWLAEPDALIKGDERHAWRAGDDVFGIDASFAGRPLFGVTIPFGGRLPFAGRGPAGEVAMFDAAPLLAGAPRAPFVEAPSLVSLAPGAALDLPVEAGGGTGTILSVTSPDLPSFASLTADQGSGRHVLSLRPADGDRGTHYLTVVATDIAGVSGLRRIVVNVGFQPVITNVRLKKLSGQLYKLVIDGSGFAKGEAQVIVNGFPANSVKYPSRYDSDGGRTVTRIVATSNVVRVQSIVLVQNPREERVSNGVVVSP